MANFEKQMANREVCDMIFVDYKTKKPFLVVDYANTSSTELTGETVYAYGGKGHPKKVGFSGEKGGTMTVETQIQTPKLWEMITGGTSSNSTKYVKKINSTVSSEKKITLDEKNEIASGSVFVYAAEDTELKAEIECTVSGKEITLNGEELAEGARVVIFYMVTREDVYNINIKSTNFPKAFTVYGDTYMKTEDEDILPYRLTAYKAVPQSNMSLSFSNSGDPGTVTITLDLMEDSEHNILDLTLLPEEDDE